MLRIIIFALALALPLPGFAQGLQIGGQDTGAALLRQTVLDQLTLIRAMQKQLDDLSEYARHCRVEPGCFEAAPMEAKKQPLESG